MRTHDGGVVAIGDASDSVDARQHRLHVVLVQLDGVGVRVEVVTGQRGCGPVGVGAPAGTCATLSRHVAHPTMLTQGKLPRWDGLQPKRTANSGCSQIITLVKH